MHTETLLSSHHHYITQTLEEKKHIERAMLDDLHLNLIARLKSISPSAALSVVLNPRLSFHLYFSFSPSILRG